MGGLAWQPRLGASRRCWFGQVWMGAVRQPRSGLLSSGLAVLAPAWHGVLRCGSLGLLWSDWLGASCWGAACRVWAVTAWAARTGAVGVDWYGRRGRFWWASHGWVWHGGAGLGMAALVRSGWAGLERSGSLRYGCHGWAWSGRRGAVRPVTDGAVGVRQARQVVERFGRSVRRGEVWRQR
jgi:hypothetical protein